MPTLYNDTTFTAKYRDLEHYTVTFDSKGGTDVDSQTVWENSTASVPDPEPTKENYDFVCWCSDEDATEAFDFSTAITSSRTLYAKWTAKPTYTVSFDSDGGSEVTSQTIVQGNKAVRPTDPTKNQHSFSKWVLKSDNSDWNFDTPITSDIVLKAVWTYLPPTTYLVTFDSDGGSAVDSQTIEEGHKVVKPTDPTKDGNDSDRVEYVTRDSVTFGELKDDGEFIG